MPEIIRAQPIAKMKKIFANFLLTLAAAIFAFALTLPLATAEGQEVSMLLMMASMIPGGFGGFLKMEY